MYYDQVRTIVREMYYDQVNDIYLVSKMGQIIKIQRPVCDIRGRIYNNVAGGIIVQVC